MNKKGFTLIELLIVTAIIAVITAVVFVALNPLERFQEARNAQRWQDVRAITDSIRLYQIDNNGQIPTGIDENWRMLGTDNSGCDIDCGSSSNGNNSTFIDNTSGEFNIGTHTNTQWDSGNSWLELTSAGQTNGSGSYNSNIKNEGAETTWSTLSWIPERPYGKELPNNGNSETAYSNGNANMNGNVLLMHLNESSGVISDSSGNNNNGTNNGATYGVSGQFGNAISFDGVNDHVDIIDDDSLELFANQDMSYSGWFKTSASGLGTMAIYDKRDSVGTFRGIAMAVRTNGVFWVRSYYGLTRITSQTTEVYNNGFWHHFTVVLDRDANQILYIDGVLKTSDDMSANYNNNMSNLVNSKIGMKSYSGSSLVHFSGMLDEIAIYNRALSATEILNNYRRGILDLKYQVRSCDDDACSGESFIGPDGTGSTFYSEINNTSIGLPSFNLTNIVDNQYFQYKATFETDNSAYTPELNSVTVENDGGGGSGGETLESSCLDLSSDLSQKLNTIPQDSKDGSAEKTYYAIRKQTAGQIDVMSCSAENDKIIKMSK